MKWLNENSKSFLSRGYLTEGVTAEKRIRTIADTAEKILNIKGFADKFYDYMEKGYYSLSSPVWANFGIDKGLPISCFGSYLSDNMGDILYTTSEVGMMSKFGGGTSGYFGELRHRGAPIKDNGESSGAVHFMKLFESTMDVVSQGSTRRGRFAPYLPIDHPDIEEFLKIGTEGDPIQELTHGVIVTDKWMEKMVSGDPEKRTLWAKVIQRRVEIGYPYIFFDDAVNNNTVDVYKDKGLKIYASNLCSEVMLPSNDEWSFVCNLSSMNILHYDEWKDTDAVETMVFFLDAVMTDFIKKLEKMRDSESREENLAFYFMEKTYNFAKANRALGVGALGWHSYLQSKMIPFESLEAAKLNSRIFSLIQKRSHEASRELAALYGEPEVLKGYGRRNATLTAIAPTTSSAFILGQVSQSIEPIWSNCYVKDIAKIKVTIQNPYLKEVLKTYNKDTKEVWNSIRDNDGSVQHLDFLSTNEKEVFKTFSEIDQYVILDQASTRQLFLDQSQSLNITVNPKMSAKQINELYLFAWENKIKTLYYQHSTNAAQQFSKDKLCSSCEA
ncbi:ribonucleoside-diphosphate reductase subunit alpha [Paenibacillus sp. EKM102P]|uniref:ribonucleoside-diphosphate reductase subunit alpha n=1 Tax=unclassified Paenibacillus TaxID=185978 RepID=UPI00142E10C2|nr:MULTISPECIES: ribonucleoside-diphosphate reductase subunit alpha [unclassified Paenibacillus]KAF6620593.1 ribonucleoside-diphosphate reductase subunit alpha [Paenibacillus sp. EKM101P]KAF6623586.1 ribonucleoside-diphosphate reductase subunit alpha [Paenibacillus sp. EKM102P]KAF6633853.1 ribonucleoside-diphosphate reductase subunit alpha [Paenibacillus sp. EKM10P]KAF6649378.1 ribonucleoside-diphosphate reductase subunit alpha [Paenibacillus sp. EKM11P]